MSSEQGPLDGYNQRADQLHWEETESDDWISPPRRACRYYDDDPATGIVLPSDEAYLMDGIVNGTSVEQDRAVNNCPEPGPVIVRYVLPQLQPVAVPLPVFEMASAPHVEGWFD